MKLHQIRTRNINSLYGDQAVDLDEDLRGASLFLVVGRTGAGKSTLLDAASLALFGETPRLPKARGTLTDTLASDDPRRAMSWGTADCLAEVVFSRRTAGRRERYRARWSCTRARGRADGNFQAPHRSLERWDAASGAWQLVQGGKRVEDYRNAFEEALGGMSRQEFERRILLAQGRFADFVQADPKDRAAMLERLTDAGRFTKVGLAVRDRHRWALDQLRDATSRRAGVTFLADPERAALVQEVAELATAMAGAREAEATARERSTWLTQAVALASQVAQAQAQIAQQARAEADAAADLGRLSEHLRCAAGRDKARRAGMERRARAALREKAARHEATLEALQSRAEQALKAAEQAATDVRAAKAEQTRLAPEVQQARALRQTVQAATTESQRAETARRQTAEAFTRAAERLTDATTALNEARDAVERTRRACEANRDGEALAPQLSGLQALWGAWKDAVAAARSRLQEATAAVGVVEGARREARSTAVAAAGAREDAAAAGRDLALAALGLATAGGAPDEGRSKDPTEGPADAGAEDAAPEVTPEQATQRARARRERLTALRDHLHAALALADKRDALREGDPCPVCGSLVHPSADDARARDNDARLRDEADALKRRLEAIDAARDALDLARERATAAATLAHQAVGVANGAAERAMAADEAAQRAAALASETDGRARQARAALLEALPGLAPDAGPEQVDAAVQAAAGKVAAWQQAAQAHASAERRLADAQPTCAAAVEAHKSAQAKHDEAVTAAELRREGLGLAREALAEALQGAGLAGRDPEEVERACAGALQAAEHRHQAAQTQAQQADAALQEALGVHKRHTEELGERDQMVQEAEEALALTLTELGLDVAELEARTLTPDQEAAISARKQILERERIRVDALLAERTRAQDVHGGRRPPGAPERPDAAQAEAAKTALADASARLGALSAHSAERQASLRHDDAQRARGKELEAAEEAAAAAAQLWTRLNRLIGERNGQAFRDFAMTMTLQQLVDIANHHMRQLSERYTLAVERDPDGHAVMGFSVVDACQADASRALTTLSGGETFLVSLSLALGLAGLSTASMPVETLLLDEGFGTLDGDTLELAMAALGRLRDNDVQVGIISHVEALREHVPAQILVEVLGEGRSVLRALGREPA